MIEGGWPFVIAAYAVTSLGLGALALMVVLRAARWARQARDLEKRP